MSRKNLQGAGDMDYWGYLQPKYKFVLNLNLNLELKDASRGSYHCQIKGMKSQTAERRYYV